MSAISANIKDLTRQFVEVQSQLDITNKHLTQLRDTKKHVETELIKHIKSAGLTDYGITFQGKKLYISNENSYDTLTYKYLEECLLKLYGNNREYVKQIIDFIKKYRVTRKSASQVIKVSNSQRKR